MCWDTFSRWPISAKGEVGGQQRQQPQLGRSQRRHSPGPGAAGIELGPQLLDLVARIRSAIWLPYWLVPLGLSAARLVLTLSRAAWIPAWPASGGSSWLSLPTDAFGAVASAQAWDGAAVVPLAAAVVARAAPLVSPPEPRRRRPRGRPWRGAGAWQGGARMMSARAGRVVGPLFATFAA